MQQTPEHIVATMNAWHRGLTESFYYRWSGMTSKHSLSLVCFTTRCATCSPTKNKTTGLLEVQMNMSTRFFEMFRMIGRLRSDLPLLGRLLKAWKDGSYRGLSVRTLASLAGALLYVVSPVDLIPDFIPGVGFIDDAAVLALLLHSLAQDLAAFRIWEERRGNG
jgi:uncharacterized membrane protein YkvA (DUF1232 family)